ncbi:MAG TPA: hypothetical protein PK867_15900, partial [Pirellulales bacterium]|nr:hypothetical protein [Pirellulales bacterium]
MIEAAVLRQSGYVRNFQIGKYGKDAARILNEIAAAKACLLDTGKPSKYDAELKARQAAANAIVQPAVAPAAPAVDFDQLAATAMELPLPTTGGFTRSKPRRLGAPSSKRRPSAFPWHVPLGIAATLAVTDIAFIMLRPRAVEPPTDEVS